MALVIDHVFVACTAGAPEADALLDAGFVEGSRKVHPGQGTANRRFFFDGFMLELLWIADRAEATGERTRRTQLWERCADPASSACPFGVVFRAYGDASPPFRTWAYRPGYLPAGAVIEFADSTTLEEPALLCVPTLARAAHAEPRQHRLPFARVRSVAVGVRELATLSPAALAVRRLGLLGYFQSEAPLLRVQFEGADELQVDLRPSLPVVLRAGE